MVVVGPQFAAALLARDLGDEEPEEERRFDYRVTYDRATVLAAATMLMHLVPAETPLQHGLAVAAGPG